MAETETIEVPAGMRVATGMKALNGKRVRLYSFFEETGPTYQRDLRAASELFSDPGDSRQYVRVVDEAAWYAWRADRTWPKPEQCPHAIAVPAARVFVEI